MENAMLTVLRASMPTQVRQPESRIAVSENISFLSLVSPVLHSSRASRRTSVRFKMSCRHFPATLRTAFTSAAKTVYTLSDRAERSRLWRWSTPCSGSGHSTQQHTLIRDALMIRPMQCALIQIVTQNRSNSSFTHHCPHNGTQWNLMNTQLVAESNKIAGFMLHQLTSTLPGAHSGTS